MLRWLERLAHDASLSRCYPARQGRRTSGTDVDAERLPRVRSGSDGVSQGQLQQDSREPGHLPTRRQRLAHREPNEGLRRASLGISRVSRHRLRPLHLLRTAHADESRFLNYLLTVARCQRIDAAARCHRRSTSTRSRSTTTSSRALPVRLPPLAEQRAIADYLDAETARIDALIAKKQQLIHLLEERWGQYVRQNLARPGDWCR